MTKTKKMIRDITEFQSLLLHNKLALFANPIKMVEFEDSNRITWATFNGTIINGNFATWEEYISIIERNQYSILLYDGSIIQISYDMCSDGIIGHRLAYYPWPFTSFDEELLKTDPVLDVFNLYKNENTNYRLISPFRFDYSEKEPEYLSTKSHLHINSNDVRIYVSKPICFGQFIRFVFYNFYPKDWESFSFLQNYSRSTLVTGKKVLFEHNEFQHIHLHLN